VLGASFFAIEHMIPALQQTAGLRVHGIASRELAKAEAVAEQFGLTQAYGDYDSMLADPENIHSKREMGGRAIAR